MNAGGSYILITPAKNEEALIGTTIESVVNQTRRPAEWVIVSDGSTDRTDAIVQAASAMHPWIRLLALAPRPNRNFAAVVRATETGLSFLSVDDYDYVGLLDADVRFQPDYFERVMEEFEADPELGLAGGTVIDWGHPRDRFPRNLEDVPGAVQFFRRRCFENLGGLLAIPEGGWDALTCARARMTGYKTRLLTSLVVDHLKPRNVAEGGLMRRYAQLGLRDYALGYHPAFEGLKCLRRLKESPFIISGLARWTGYCWGAVRRRKRLIPRDLLQFVRNEQSIKIRQLFGLARNSRPAGTLVSAGKSEAR